MESVFDYSTTPDDWHPRDDERRMLQEMFEKGSFGDTNITQQVLERVELGIASQVDRHYLTIMYFLNSFRK